MPHEGESSREQHAENLTSEVKRRLIDGTVFESEVEQLLDTARKREGGASAPEAPRSTEQDLKVETLPRVSVEIRSRSETIGTAVLLKHVRGYYLDSVDMTLDGLTTNDLRSTVDRLGLVLGETYPKFGYLRLIVKDKMRYRDLSATEPLLPPDFGLAGYVWINNILDGYIDLCKDLNYKPKLRKQSDDEKNMNLWTVGVGVKAENP